MFSHTASKAVPSIACATAPRAQLGELANFCKASADQLRLQILRVLRNDSFGVSELCSIFDIRQPAMSHHLKVLSSAALVATRREGNSIFYRRATPGSDSELKSLQQQLLNTVDQIDLPGEIESKVAKLYQLREESSRNFFRHNAHKFREQQDLIASYSQYAETVSTALRDALPQPRPLALEIGPGDGAFLAQLSPGSNGWLHWTTLSKCSTGLALWHRTKRSITLSLFTAIPPARPSRA